MKNNHLKKSYVQQEIGWPNQISIVYSRVSSLFINKIFFFQSTKLPWNLVKTTKTIPVNAKQTVNSRIIRDIHSYTFLVTFLALGRFLALTNIYKVKCNEALLWLIDWIIYPEPRLLCSSRHLRFKIRILVNAWYSYYLTYLS